MAEFQMSLIENNPLLLKYENTNTPIVIHSLGDTELSYKPTNQSIQVHGLYELGIEHEPSTNVPIMIHGYLDNEMQRKQRVYKNLRILSMRAEGMDAAVGDGQLKRDTRDFNMLLPYGNVNEPPRKTPLEAQWTRQ